MRIRPHRHLRNHTQADRIDKAQRAVLLRKSQQPRLCRTLAIDDGRDAQTRPDRRKCKQPQPPGTSHVSRPIEHAVIIPR
jgi:hypothetical protein